VVGGHRLTAGRRRAGGVLAAPWPGQGRRGRCGRGPGARSPERLACGCARAARARARTCGPAQPDGPGRGGDGGGQAGLGDDGQVTWGSGHRRPDTQVRDAFPGRSARWVPPERIVGDQLIQRRQVVRRGRRQGLHRSVPARPDSGRFRAEEQLKVHAATVTPPRSPTHWFGTLLMHERMLLLVDDRGPSASWTTVQDRRAGARPGPATRRGHGVGRRRAPHWRVADDRQVSSTSGSAHVPSNSGAVGL
jgi:hypothetical protein